MTFKLRNKKHHPHWYHDIPLPVDSPPTLFVSLQLISSTTPTSPIYSSKIVYVGGAPLSSCTSKNLLFFMVPHSCPCPQLHLSSPNTTEHPLPSRTAQGDLDAPGLIYMTFLYQIAPSQFHVLKSPRAHPLLYLHPTFFLPMTRALRILGSLLSLCNHFLKDLVGILPNPLHSLTLPKMHTILVCWSIGHELD